MMLGFLVIAITRFLVGGRAWWQGAQPSPRQRIYFANHSSNMDTIVLWAALPPELRRRTRPVAAKDYWDSGPLKRHMALRVLRAVLIDRKGGASALDPLHEALRAGDSLIIFPEGKRGPGPLPDAFRAGLWHLAEQHPSVELIPVWLDNLGRALPKGVFIPVPVSASALIGAPLIPSPGETKEAFLTRARNAVVFLGRSINPGLADA